MAETKQHHAGGFDVVLGNPPWERIKLQEKEFFEGRDDAIVSAPNAAARRRLIAQLPKTNPPLHEEFQDALRRADGESHLVRTSGRYPLCGHGDINTYSLFAETGVSIQGDRGRVGCIVPIGIATEEGNKLFFQHLIDAHLLISLLSFENEEFIFPAVHHAMRFSLLTVAGIGSGNRGLSDFLFFARKVQHLHDEARHFTLAADELALLNPRTRTCPVFRAKRDADLTKSIYRRWPVCVDGDDGAVAESGWALSFLRMFDMANDSGLFQDEDDLAKEGASVSGNSFLLGSKKYLPLYEAKMLHQFDHRFATYEGKSTTQVTHSKLPESTAAEHADSNYLAMPRYWVPRAAVVTRLDGRWDRSWLMAFRDITATTNERTCIASVMPIAAVGHTSPLLLPKGTPVAALCLLGNLNAFVFDYVVRQKMGGGHLTYGTIKQLPILPVSTYGPDGSFGESELWFWQRVLEISHTALDLGQLSQDCSYDGPPFIWDEQRRFLIRCELDAAYFHLYGIDRDDVAYIMETFPIVKRKDIARTADADGEGGSYTTKDTILAIYDEMTEVMQANAAAEAAGQQPTARYQTRLDPPPGPPVDTDGNFIPMAQWDSANWPSHIHLPREAAVPEHRVQIESGKQVAFVLLLLDAWNKAVSKPVLERGLVLMLNDAARTTMLDQPVNAPQTASLGSLGDFVRGIDGLYDYIVTSGWVTVVGLTGLQLTTDGASRLSGAPQADRDKAQQVIDIATRLDDDEQFIAVVAEVTDDRYELVST